MRTAVKRTPRRQPRSDVTRQKILAATVELIGEVGPVGLTLALAAERAKVSRALPTYQFNTRDELLSTAASDLLQAEPPTVELGLEPLLAWMRKELGDTLAANAHVRARLALIFGPTEPITSAAVAAFCSSRLDLIRSHLERARAHHQVRADVDLGLVAAMLQGQLHGEMVRLAWRTGQADPELFLTLIRGSLAPASQRQSRPARAPAKEQQRLL